MNISGFTVKGASGRWAAGIYLYYADYCSISNNICSNNRLAGIDLADSKNNAITNNICSNNDYYGIYLSYSKNNKLTGNVLLENGILIHACTLNDYTNEIDESNTVNGKPVYYWKHTKNHQIICVDKYFFHLMT